MLMKVSDLGEVLASHNISTDSQKHIHLGCHTFLFLLNACLLWSQIEGLPEMPGASLSVHRSLWPYPWVTICLGKEKNCCQPFHIGCHVSDL